MLCSGWDHHRFELSLWRGLGTGSWNCWHSDTTVMVTSVPMSPPLNLQPHTAASSSLISLGERSTLWRCYISTSGVWDSKKRLGLVKKSVGFLSSKMMTAAELTWNHEKKVSALLVTALQHHCVQNTLHSCGLGYCQNHWNLSNPRESWVWSVWRQLLDLTNIFLSPGDCK